MADDFFGSANHAGMFYQLVAQQCLSSYPCSQARYAQWHSIDSGVTVTSPSETCNQWHVLQVAHCMRQIGLRNHDKLDGNASGFAAEYGRRNC